MPVELRKRKTPTEPAPAPPAKKAGAASKGAPAKKGASAASTAKAADKKEKSAPAASASKPAKSETSGPPKAGDTVDLDGFGGEIETNDGEKTTLKALVEESKSGIVLLAYPKASTPGCTNQVCMARDSFAHLTKTGLSIFGISRDSPKANTTFKTKQSLPYALLCDKEGTLISAVGLKKAPSGTQRGVFAVDKNGLVLLAQPGGPAATVDAVKALVDEGKPDGAADEKEVEEK